jgi:dihydrofolate reductase
MPGPQRIEGFAIISEDGMLADAERRIPAGLQVEADQSFFHGSLAAAAAVVHGRHSHEGGSLAPRRPRLIATRQIAGTARDPGNSNALFWNPQGATLAQAWTDLGAPDGMLAVIGGADLYQLFVTIGYDAFHLTRAAGIYMPGGRTVFPGLGRNRTPEDVLRDAGLVPAKARILDRTAGITLVSWYR